MGTRNYYICGWCPEGRHQKCAGGICDCSRQDHKPTISLARYMAGAVALDPTNKTQIESIAKQIMVEAAQEMMK